jgi:hypothetical protein
MVFEAHPVRRKDGPLHGVYLPSRSALTLPFGGMVNDEPTAKKLRAGNMCMVRRDGKLGHLSGLRYLASGLQWEK